MLKFFFEYKKEHYSIEPYSIDTYTVTRIFKLGAGAGDNGYVEFKLTIDRNIQAQTSRLVGIKTTPGFNSLRPLLMSISTTSSPSTGSIVSMGTLMLLSGME